MKYRIAYVISSFMRCGPINMLYSLVSNLDRDLFEIHCVTFKREPRDSRLADFLALGVIVHQVSCGEGNLHIVEGRKVRKALRKISPDIVHAHGPWADYFVSKERGISTVMNIHNKLDEDYVPLYGKLVGTITAKVDAESIKKATAAVSVSDSVASVVGERYGIASRVIINGVNTSVYHPLDNEGKKSVRRELAIPESDVVYLHVGNMIERKRPDFIIEAFNSWQSSHNSAAQLVFLGDGPLMDLCRRQADGNDRIRFMGKVENVVSWCQAADVMVSATTSDGMSMATLEGLACGLRMVMSDIDVHREIKRRYRLTDEDFSIARLDSFEYASCFERVYLGGHRKNGVNLPDLSASRMADEYADLYQSLAHAR